LFYPDLLPGKQLVKIAGHKYLFFLIQVVTSLRTTANFRDYDFPRTHVPSEDILDGTHEVNAAIWINGHCGKADPRSIYATELFLDYQFATASDALGDPEFVFGG